MLRCIRCAVVALMLAPAAGAAQDFDAGLAAAQAGDYATALQEWRPLAEQGNATAQSLLGAMYFKGLGVPQDDAEAARWLRLAAEQGDADAQLIIGTMYRTGRGVPQDDAEAARWFRKAAEQGHADAQVNLGAMYGLGLGVPRDDATAHMWLNLAAAQGSADAAEQRDKLAGRMTAADISEAQRRARVCLESGYRACD